MAFHKQIEDNYRVNIANIVQKEVELPLDCLLTIARIRVNNAKTQVTAYFTVLPETKEKTVLQILKKNRMLILQNLHDNMHLRAIPKLLFQIDVQDKKAQEIEQLLDSIKE